MFSHIFDVIGAWFRDEKHETDLGDPLDFESGPFLDYAISWVYTFKKLLIPREYRTKVGNMRCVAICSKQNKFHCKT
ncbi:hypothetical protein ABEB36_002727 [Hypothenemus hampei]|uniref:Uncharacterized protein n=1 Tax=Hypothenemus hampei TaxID=57062 RepID=A0ABD1F9F4_HYPHA